MIAKNILLFFLLFSALASCSPKTVQTGNASFYHDKYHGRQTANGEIYRKGKLTAAHKTLPFGTKVKVTNLQNGKKVKVRINDRGPFVGERIIDLSKKAARRIDLLDAGVASVEIKYR
ncbi:septal ring lytic transglycosylase RlpA family protein [Aquiflexum lacus]|uniref:septal ring lytic transglycosylase RlpA family protein n=1 Tax=Aquiflexum lacus TaxID=2483805 RepID=UPI0018940F74|nr:septal ring lytic transglycosylase RlpA family protein [Aquiflexum lacus]